MRDHELVLAARQSGAAGRDALVEAFTPVIASLARDYRRSAPVEWADLIQAGEEGLLRALERYDPELETPFWAYAVWWVREAMQRLMADKTEDSPPKRAAARRRGRRVPVRGQQREPASAPH